ncbi:MAG: nucleotide sugar dehydrogenase [Phycisphaeraceae bacterium]
MSFLQRVADRQVVVGVIGLGYVGLPLLQTFFEARYRVLGFDVDASKIDALKAGRSYISHLGADYARKLAGSDRFDATSDLGRLGEADAIAICVPTPLGPHLEPDLSFVESTADAIAATLRPGQLIILESTTYPGTTRVVVLPRLAASDLASGRDFFLAYSPEREDPGNTAHATRTVPKLVGGIDDASGEAAVALYRSAFERVVPVSSAEVAEAAKLHENIYRAVNIALANEMKMVLSEMGIDVWEVIEAAATKPFGFQPFYPGPGLGGHCIPIDPFYLTWKAREIGQDTRFVELAGQINRSMPAYVVGRTARALNDAGKAIHGSKILILGVAYKPNVSDLRESPAFEIIEQLRELGGEIDYSDPHVPETPKVRRHDLKMRSVELTPDAVADYDAVIVATDHRDFDWPMIFEHARLLIDTRSVARKAGIAPRDGLISA